VNSRRGRQTSIWKSYNGRMVDNDQWLNCCCSS